jgi:FAD/FMN-containing dehydrogenase
MNKFLIFVIIGIITIILINYLFYAQRKNPHLTTDMGGFYSVYLKGSPKPTSLIQLIDIVRKNILSDQKITICGASHSMGGQTLYPGSVRIQTNAFNKVIDFDPVKSTVTVEAGILWLDLIKFLSPKGFCPQTLQSYSSFSVGGSVSVNIHGITSDESLVKSILELEIILPNGSIVKCSPNNASKLFAHVVGGYGLFGVITTVKLRIVPNHKLEFKSEILNPNDFMNKFLSMIDDPNIKIKTGRINLVNPNEITLYTFKIIPGTSNFRYVLDKPSQMSPISKILYKWIMPHKFAQRIRFTKEKIKGVPLDMELNTDSGKLLSGTTGVNSSKSVRTTTAIQSEILYESAESVSHLYNPWIQTNKSHILQEFFVPVEQFIPFYSDLKNILMKNYVECFLLNVTIRFVKQDSITALPYAPVDMFAFVFYWRTNLISAAEAELHQIHTSLVDLTQWSGGTFYLPYMHHYSKTQLLKSYPKFNEFVMYKKQLDPNNIFTNLWFSTYDK